MMPGVSGSVREAQTTAIYGGDLYVGVWPWSELWRYDAHGDEWKFVRRNFRKPPITDTMNHPYEDRVVAYNEEHGTDLVINDWGQRVTGLAPNGDAMFLSVSAKGCPVRDMRHSFLHDDEVWNQYRMVYRVRKPGSVSVPVAWTGKPTTLAFTIGEDRSASRRTGGSGYGAGPRRAGGGGIGRGYPMGPRVDVRTPECGRRCGPLFPLASGRNAVESPVYPLLTGISNHEG